MYIHSQTALWHIDPTGSWTRLAESPLGRLSYNSALHSLPDGRLLIYGGSRDQTLSAYSADGDPLWQTPLDDLSGDPFIFDADNTLLVADGSGTVAVMDAASGAVCDRFTVWGHRGANAWAGLGSDGILRLHIADQVIGLDWAALAASCPAA